MLALLTHADLSAAAECADHGPVTTYTGPRRRAAERDSIFRARAELGDPKWSLLREQSRPQWH